MSEALPNNGITDVELRRNLRPMHSSGSIILGMGTAMLAGILIVTIRFTLFPALPSYLGSAFFCGSGVLLIPLFRKREIKKDRRLLMETLANMDECNFRETVANLRSMDGMAYRDALSVCAVCELLIERGFAGEIMRTHPTPLEISNREAIVPIAVQFEPQPLSEAHPSFPGLADCDSAESDERPLRSEYPLWKRHYRLSGGLAFILILAAIVLYSLGIIINLIAGVGIEASELALLLMYCLIFASLGGTGAWSRRSQWALVPAGVIVRKPKRFTQQWNLGYFVHDESILFVHQNNKRQWLAIVAKAEQSEYAYMTKSEADLLLRAWLSPLPPPDKSHLTDWA